MSELLTAAQMRAIERAAIESGEVTGLELMERAGRGVVEAVFEQWPELAGEAPGGGAAPTPPRYLGQEEGQLRAVVLCGPGNNGGDGFVVARLLAGRGWRVEVFLYGDAGKLPPDARVNYERWRAMGEVGDYWDFDAPATPRDLTVDALFGTGMSRPMQLAAQHEGIMATSERLVAVDLPTGLQSDSGASMEPHFHADLTVAFHRAKIGQYLGWGGFMSRDLKVADIGLLEVPDDAVRVVDRPCGHQIGGIAKGQFATKAQYARNPAHKYSHGHALVLAGGPGHGGAARLAARGALRIGAGLVTLGCPPSAMAENAAQLNAIMVRELADAGALGDLLRDPRLGAICLGPGLGRGDNARALVVAALEAGRPCVLDADGLAAFADAPDRLFALLHEAVVLTPHGGEFARLFGDLAEKLEQQPGGGPACSKVDATRAAAARAGCVVLFKGPDTVIAAPDGRCAINSAHYRRAAPWLATAGSGDVLAGFIAGLLARGFHPMQAAETGAWLHVECARAFGPGLIAEDLPEALPGVLRDLGA